MSEQTKPTARLRSMLTMGGSGVITADEQSAVKELVFAFDAQALEIEKLKSELEAVKSKSSTDLISEKYRLKEQVSALKEAVALKQEACSLMKEAADQFKSERDRLRAELEAVRDKYEELTSYMPKIPTEPYEKRLARECRTLQSRVEKLKKGLDMAINELQCLNMIGPLPQTIETGRKIIELDKLRYEDAKLESESGE